MRLYDSLGPNPRMVRMFLIEKGIDLPTRQLDIMDAENRRPPYTDKNPGGQVPALELDDGRVLGETVVICEYLEEQHPKPVLIGATPTERATTRMWTRRVELGITEHLYNGFRFAEGLTLFKDRLHVIPQAADDLKATAQEKLGWLDALIEGRPWIAGERLSLADLVLYCALDFGQTVGQPLDRSRENVADWFDRMSARPSADASLHPAARAAGMRG